jgi:hypothetical protein
MFAAIAGVAAPLLAPAGAAAAATAPKCATSGLVVWLDTNGNGAAGSVFYNLEFTNLSGRSCSLTGYPGVSAVGLGGAQLGSAASRDRSRKPRTVTLKSGATATAVLRIVDAGNFSSTACREVTAAGLRVFPPNQAASRVVPFPFSACSRTGPVYLTVRAVQHT